MTALDERTPSLPLARRWRHHRYAIGALGLALVGGPLVFLVATDLFPYHSLNHDEAVYLQQAAMLLEGQLVLRPPVAEVFRPWFFVDGGDYLYPKYSPVPAAIFAPGLALGVPRASLAVVAAAIVFLTYVVVAEAFSRRVGLLAAAFVFASPLFIVNSAVFLPYAPTALLNLTFAAAVLRADRTGWSRSLVYAAVGGVAIGLAFFARPYTALLFAAPFVLYALWTLREGSRDTLATWGVVAVLGFSGVCLTLAYNAVLTGAPLRFPYAVFAPRDGLGFGIRAILGHEVAYTPILALRANIRVLALFFTEWIAGGLFGTSLALGGLLVLAVRAVRRRLDPHQAAVLGLLVSVPVGNLYFWGNLNLLGALSVPDDGLIHYLGPYYHFDLLIPVAALAACGTLWLFDGLRSALDARLASTQAQTGLVLAAFLVCAVVAGGSLAAAQPHVRANAAVTDQYETAYAPFESRDFDGALVFLPAPYGPWLNHPFQPLRNDPGYDGNVVYALSERPFAVVDAFPNRSLYRYSYRGQWAPVVGSPVEPKLREIDAVAGERVTLDATLEIPAAADRVSIRVATDDGQAYYAVRGTRRDLPLRVVVAGGEARVLGPLRAVGKPGVSVGASDTLAITVFVDYGTGSGFSYDLALPVATEGASTRALSPAVKVCRVPLRCGTNGGAAYLPGETPPALSVETTLRAGANRSGSMRAELLRIDASRTDTSRVGPTRTDGNGSTTPQRTRSPNASW